MREQISCQPFKGTEQRRANRFRVVVPVEIRWEEAGGTATETTEANEVNMFGGLLNMKTCPRVGSKVALTNLLSSETTDALVAAKGDGVLTFDPLTDVFYSGTRHEEDQPCHLVITDPSICDGRCRKEYGNPCQYFCPAAVYEIVPKEGKYRLKIHAFELRALQDVRHC